MSAEAWTAHYTFNDILGISASLRRTLELSQHAARADYPVVLVGESGTGKELIAHAIHNASARRRGPFVAVNCGVLCGEIAKAELCGYEPGSFTGADRHAHQGFFDAAREGTLFLDEFQDLPPTPQSVLLRFLETSRFVRVGGTQQVHSAVRVVVATNLPIRELSDGRIRSDLIYRLNCLSIEIPPLRDRRQDIRPIAEKCLREELHYLGEVDEAVWQALESCPYPWLGNARELRNVLLRTILVSSRDRLVPGDLPSELWHCDNSAAERIERRDSDSAGNSHYGSIVALKAVFDASHHNVSETARRLGIHRSTVYRRLRRRISSKH
jgi:transcriptional regulator with PAS, ATPase and Fis domain